MQAFFILEYCRIKYTSEYELIHIARKYIDQKLEIKGKKEKRKLKRKRRKEKEKERRGQGGSERKNLAKRN